MGNFRLAEHFVSINGEGQNAGELALFLRFTGCNLHCDWCDTTWANDKDAPKNVLTTAELADIAKEAIENCDVRNVTLTGGEPLLQQDIAELCAELAKLGLNVEIETNGAIPLESFLENFDRNSMRPSITMDYKLPSSKMEQYMCTENLALLDMSDTLKFVCGSIEDMERAVVILEDAKPRCTAYFSPVFGRLDPADMVEFMKEHKLGTVRLQLQLHKMIWDPDKRGV